MSAEPSRRLLSVNTHLGPDAFLLIGFSGREGLSRLFHFELEMLSERDLRLAGDLAGRPISWAVHSAGRPPRFFHGVVRRFVAADREVGKFRTYRAVVVPWIWVLSRGAEHRGFADRTLPEIVDEVFRDHGFTDYHSALRRSYARRKHCVQYRESPFHFISRLLEEEGAFYTFRHEEGKHTLVLADDAGAYRPCPENQPRYSPGVVARDRISTWEHRFDVSQGPWTPTDEDFEAPPGVSGPEPEVAAHHVVVGASGCCTFTPGGKFVLGGHGSEAENRGYALIDVRHAAADPSFTPGGGGKTYENTFTCIPDTAVFRPPPATPRPIVAGPQTAVVVGPNDGERVDAADGGVEIRFLWGRERQPDRTTCRVCAAAGETFRPRVGQEVLVTFLDGDPDRPMLAGSDREAEPPPALVAPQEPVAVALEEPPVTPPDVDVPEAMHNQQRMNENPVLEIQNGRTAVVREGDDAVVIEKGDQTIRLPAGRSLTDAAEAIELRVGPSVIRLDPTGITIQGMTIAIEGHAQAEMKGLMTRVAADAVLAVQGGATVIG